MLSLSALDVALAVNEGELIEEILLTLLAAPQLAWFFEKHPRLRRAVLTDLPSWRKSLEERVREALVPAALADEFCLYQKSTAADRTEFYRQLPEILKALEDINSPFSPEAHRLHRDEQETTSHQILFNQRWRISLILQVTAYHKEILEQEKEQLLAELQQHLALSGNLDPIISENEQASGKLWDLAKGSLKSPGPADDLLLRYSEFLKSQPELEKLASLLGRSQTAKSVPQDSAVTEPVIITELVPDQTPEEVSGVGLSDDVLRLLPAELALLGISGLELEFYRKLAEKQLYTYRLQGDHWQERQVMRPIVHHKDEKQPRGPFIICIDTSGSMGGFNERCAKAFCLALVKIAMADNRQCHVMLFSTEQVHYDFLGQDGIEQMTRFLLQSFKGGTDLASCLTETAKRLETPQWRDADVVVISDFIAQRLPDEVVKQVKRSQQQGKHRFHAVALSHYGKPGIMRIFDHIWRFDTGLKNRLLRRFRR
ncbi:ATPase RavA stimulator ViaA [Morganella sp. Je.2.23]|uniref:ATPase RavA stimulator ViaA n=1 Tax=Morganella sp. Je.2.23 TaxID=3142840 RepID=UPI003DA7BB0B